MPCHTITVDIDIMNFIWLFMVSVGFIVLNLNGRDALFPSYMVSREENNSTLNESSPYDEEYESILKKTIDLLWDSKCYIFQVRKYHRRLRIMDGEEIEYLRHFLDQLQSYLNLLGDIVTRVFERHPDTLPWDRINPLNKTIVDKLLKDWKEIKEEVDKYKPTEGIEEYDKLCEAVNGAIRDLPLQYKPIYEQMMKLQNETHISDEERARMDEQTTIISLYF